MVFNENGEAKTTSFAVADAFGKRHSDVLKAIKNMRCSDNFAKRNFALCFEINWLRCGDIHHALCFGLPIGAICPNGE